MALQRAIGLEQMLSVSISEQNNYGFIYRVWRMRQRQVKHLEERIESNSTFLVEEPEAYKGKWHELFGNDKPIYLEIGCGKGQFILKHAVREKDKK